MHWHWHFCIYVNVFAHLLFVVNQHSAQLLFWYPLSFSQNLLLFMSGASSSEFRSFQTWNCLRLPQKFDIVLQLALFTCFCNFTIVIIQIRSTAHGAHAHMVEMDVVGKGSWYFSWRHDETCYQPVIAMMINKSSAWSNLWTHGGEKGCLRWVLIYFMIMHVITN